MTADSVLESKGDARTESGATGPLQKGPFAGITRNVVVVGLVSLFTDISSEMISPILPLFLMNVLGAGAATVGLIEGLGEATASLLKMISGWISDRMGRRKPLMLIGYGLSDLTKPLLALAAAWPQVLAIRFADRFGKGVRGAPRDALIADSAPPAVRGKAFGFHRAMDTVGAAIGPLIAFGVLSLSANNYRVAFVVASIPGMLAVLILTLALREGGPAGRQGAPVRLGFASLGRDYLVFTGVATLFALGNSSDAFLILRAQDLGLATALVPLAYFGFNLVYALLAIPLGSLSDRIGRRRVITVGYLVFAGVYLGFALAGHAWPVWPLFAAYGAYYALTEGVQRAYVTDLVPAEQRGAALGTFNAATGAAMLPASLIGGLLWQEVAPAATFCYGAAFAAMAALLFWIATDRLPGQHPGSRQPGCPG